MNSYSGKNFTKWFQTLECEGYGTRKQSRSHSLFPEKNSCVAWLRGGALSSQVGEQILGEPTGGRAPGREGPCPSPSLSLGGGTHAVSQEGPGRALLLGGLFTPASVLPGPAPHLW